MVPYFAGGFFRGGAFAMAFSREQMLEKVRTLGGGYWYHNIDLGQGVQTAPDDPGGKHARYLWSLFRPFIPDDLKGKAVLDIGCWSGFFSIEFKKLGAAKVIGVDELQGRIDQARFAAEVLGLDIDYRVMSAYDVDKLGMEFDYIVFLGLLYHLRHPLYMLDKLAGMLKGTMLFQCFTPLPSGGIDVKDNYTREEIEGGHVLEHPGFPRMCFIEKNANNDPTNWWFPNEACLWAMLRSSGFKNIRQLAREVFICDSPRAAQDPSLPSVPKGYFLSAGPDRRRGGSRWSRLKGFFSLFS